MLLEAHTSTQVDPRASTALCALGDSSLLALLPTGTVKLLLSA
jgi:hypothetical protein